LIRFCKPYGYSDEPAKQEELGKRPQKRNALEDVDDSGALSLAEIPPRI
jgi:hypothetical protein